MESEPRYELSLEWNLMEGIASRGSRVVQKLVGVTDLQRRFRQVLDEVVKDRVSYILTRGSRPEAVLLRYEEYTRLLAIEARAGDARPRWEHIRSRHVPRSMDRTDEVVESEVAEAVREVRSPH